MLVSDWRSDVCSSDLLGVTRSRDLLSRRSRAELLVAGVKVASQTPPIRSGRRVVFLTLDDATGPVDATFFEDAQGPYAATVQTGRASGRERVWENLVTSVGDASIKDNIHTKH